MTGQLLQFLHHFAQYLIGLISLRPDKMLEGGGGVVVQKYVSALEKNAGGVGVMLKYFIDVKKCWGGRVRPIYFRGLIKCWGGGGAMPKYFMDLKISPELQTTCS